LGVRGRPPSARTHAIGRPLPRTHTASHPHTCIPRTSAFTPTCASPPAPQRSTSASCCGPTHATETPNGSHISIRARTHGFDPARPREQNSAAPPTHHHTPTKQQAKRETQDGRTCPPAHMHPPAHMRAHLQQYDHSHSALARHSSASTSQHESPPHLCSAAHPSHIPLAPEGRASSPSLLHPSGPRRPSHRRFASVCVIRDASPRLLVSIDHCNAKFLIPPRQAVLAIK